MGAQKKQKSTVSRSLKRREKMGTIACKNCEDLDDAKSKTGAMIDRVYHCQVCYEQRMDAMLNDVLKEVFERRG